MNAFAIGFCNPRVALGAGLGNISLVDRRSGIAPLLHIVRAVAIIACRRLGIAAGHCHSVNAAFISGDEPG